MKDTQDKRKPLWIERAGALGAQGVNTGSHGEPVVEKLTRLKAGPKPTSKIAAAAVLSALMMGSVLMGCPVQPDEPTTPTVPTVPEKPVQVLPALTIGAAAATITQNDNVLDVSVTVPNGAALADIALTDGSNFAFAGKTFNFNITFASGTYNEAMVDAIKAKFTAKGAAVGQVITSPEKPQQPPVGEVTLPGLTIGLAAATITQNDNVLDVSVTVPNGAALADIGLTDGANFAFAGKTFNFNITFASGTYDEAMVDAIKAKFTAKGASAGSVITSPEKPQQPPVGEVTLPALTIGTASATITQNDNVLDVSVTVPNGAALADIGLTDGSNFAFAGKTFNFDITFASGTYDEAMVDAIKAKFTAKGASAGQVITSPEKPQQPPVGEVTLPGLTIGATAATITQNDNVLDVAITVPNGATLADIGLTDGSNFAFAGKTFNFNITFASGTYDEAMVDAIKAKFTAKGASVGSVITSPEKPQQPPALQPAMLKIDGMEITIPVPAEGVNTITVAAAVSNGTVADFADPSGILAGKTVNLTLDDLSDKKNRINYSAIAAIEAAFKAKGATVSSDTISGVIPVFNVSRDNDSITALIDSKNVTAQNPDVKIVNNIHALYNNGNKILQVLDPIQLVGDIYCSELAKIQAPAGNIYADDTLRLTNYGREIELADLLATYTKCGFTLDGNNNFFPKLGLVSPYTGDELPIEITDSAKSWDIYRLFERYNSAGKMDSLAELLANDITVAGENANGLYDANNQPKANFPYKVNGDIIWSMIGRFKAFENMYEDGTHPLPTNVTIMTVKNFATKSNLPNTRFYADGACFFQYAPPYIDSTGAVKIMQIGDAGGTSATAKYLDLRNLTPDQRGLVENYVIRKTDEVAFSSLNAAPQDGLGRTVFDYDTGYYVENGVTKLIPTGNQIYASDQTSSIYGVLDLQGWTGATPPRDKSAIQSPVVAKASTPEYLAPEFYPAGSAAIAAALDRKLHGYGRS
ncbi:MAG: hypothetical protein LBK25_06590 [Treponema sp.]|jgi:hypothetical protein|nr:hypothetical protein [Treponema sp.]